MCEESHHAHVVCSRLSFVAPIASPCEPSHAQTKSNKASAPELALYTAPRPPYANSRPMLPPTSINLPLPSIAERLPTPVHSHQRHATSPLTHTGCQTCWTRPTLPDSPGMSQHHCRHDIAPIMLALGSRHPCDSLRPLYCRVGSSVFETAWPRWLGWALSRPNSAPLHPGDAGEAVGHGRALC
jgi:hypothetical protein